MVREMIDTLSLQLDIFKASIKLFATFELLAFVLNRKSRLSARKVLIDEAL